VKFVRRKPVIQAVRHHAGGYHNGPSRLHRSRLRLTPRRDRDAASLRPAPVPSDRSPRPSAARAARRSTVPRRLLAEPFSVNLESGRYPCFRCGSSAKSTGTVGRCSTRWQLRSCDRSVPSTGPRTAVDRTVIRGENRKEEPVLLNLQRTPPSGHRIHNMGQSLFACCFLACFPVSISADSTVNGSLCRHASE